MYFITTKVEQHNFFFPFYIFFKTQSYIGTHSSSSTLYAFILPRDDNGVGRGRVSLSHTHPRIKNSSLSPYPNPTGIKPFSHPHPYWVTGIISYPYPYPCSNYFNINFYKRKKIMVKKT